VIEPISREARLVQRALELLELAPAPYGCGPATARRGALKAVAARLDDALKVIPTGTADRPRRRKRIDVAVEHADAWAGSEMPKNEPIGDGHDEPEPEPAATPGASLVDQDERAERGRVTRQSTTDLYALVPLLESILDHAAELARDPAPLIAHYLRTESRKLERIVDRLVETMHPRKLPKANEGLPGCTNCAPVTFAPVYDKAPGSGLCRWCYDHARAEGEPPPLEVVDLYHRVSPTAAGRRLAELERKRAA
jgi:hypothetical protein